MDIKHDKKRGTKEQKVRSVNGRPGQWEGGKGMSFIEDDDLDTEERLSINAVQPTENQIANKLTPRHLANTSARVGGWLVFTFDLPAPGLGFHPTEHGANSKDARLGPGLVFDDEIQAQQQIRPDAHPTQFRGSGGLSIVGQEKGPSGCESRIGVQA